MSRQQVYYATQPPPRLLQSQQQFYEYNDYPNPPVGEVRSYSAAQMLNSNVQPQQQQQHAPTTSYTTGGFGFGGPGNTVAYSTLGQQQPSTSRTYVYGNNNKTWGTTATNYERQMLTPAPVNIVGTYSRQAVLKQQGP